MAITCIWTRCPPGCASSAVSLTSSPPRSHESSAPSLRSIARPRRVTPAQHAAAADRASRGGRPASRWAERGEAERGRGVHREAGRRGGERWDQAFDPARSGVAASGRVDAGPLVSGWSSSVRSRASRTPSAPRRTRRRIPPRSTGVLKFTRCAAATSRARGRTASHRAHVACSGPCGSGARTRRRSRSGSRAGRRVGAGRGPARPGAG